MGAVFLAVLGFLCLLFPLYLQKLHRIFALVIGFCVGFLGIFQHLGYAPTLFSADFTPSVAAIVTGIIAAFICMLLPLLTLTCLSVSLVLGLMCAAFDLSYNSQTFVVVVLFVLAAYLALSSPRRLELLTIVIFGATLVPLWEDGICVCG